jgi:hypothetical protein
MVFAARGRDVKLARSDVSADVIIVDIDDDIGYP